MPSIHICPASEGTQNVIVGDCAGEVVLNVYELNIAGKTLAADDVIDLGPLPAGATVADAILVSDDLDTGGSPAIAFDCGIMSGTVGDKDATRTVGKELFDASTVAQAGGIARTTLKTAFRIAPSGADRSIGLKVAAAAATQATTGKIALHLFIKQ